MSFTKIIFSLFCFLAASQMGLSQSDYCFQEGEVVSLSSLDAEDCLGALSYDISGAGLNCLDCADSQTLSDAGSFTITVYSEGEECQEIDVIVTEAQGFMLIQDSSSNCSTYTYSESSTGAAVAWSWDFNGDGIEDENGPNGVYIFNDNGNQTVTLTTTLSNGCVTTVSSDIFVEGPISVLSSQGVIDGDVENLFSSVFNDLECVIPYCVDDPEEDFLVTLSDAGPANVSGNNITHEILLNGLIVYPSSINPPAGIDLDLAVLGANLGYNTLVYNITDDNGCIYSKEYQIYWEEDTLPTANIDNVTPDVIADGTSQYCVGDPLEFEISASSISGVSYIFAIGCGALDFNSLDPIYIETLNIPPDGTQTVVWDAVQSSCQCANNQFKAYLFVNNPCNTQPAEIATVNFNVRIDTDPEFEVPDLLCQNSNYTFFWEGDDFLGGGLCDADIVWSIIEPDGTPQPNLSDASDFTWNFDQVGEYEICLEIESDCDEGGTEICQTICVQEPLGTDNTSASFPNVSSLCLTESYQPTVTIPDLFCVPASVNWTVFPSAGVSISDNNSLSPTIEFNSKGDFTVNVNINSVCGSASYSSVEIIVGGPPSITVEPGVLTSCPDEEICFDESFCLDNCNAEFTEATVSVYEGVISDCTSVFSNDLVWASAGNPLVVFPSDMQGPDCIGSNSPCDFSWLVPLDAVADYTVVIEVINDCGTDIQCIPISIIIPGNLSIPIDSEVCSGFTIDPSLTSLSNCDWLIDNVLVWSPGSSDLVTIDSDVTVSVNCNSGACPQSTSAEITVFPSINAAINGEDVICSNGSVELEATFSANVVPSFQWFEGSCSEIQAGTATELAGENAAPFSAQNAGTFSVIISDQNGCSSCAEFTLENELGPQFNCADATFCETDMDSEIGLDCVDFNPNGILTWSVSDDMSVEISTDVPGNYTVGDLLSDYGGISENEVFTFEYSYTSENSCSYSDQFQVTIEQLGVNDLEAQSECFGSTITLLGGVEDNWNTGNLGTDDFSFSLGNLVLEPTLPPGLYTGITYDSGCSQTPYEIEINALPEVDITGETVLCNAAGSTIQITAEATGEGAITYQWFSGACEINSTISGETNPELTISSSGIYSVLVTDENGCIACSDIEITNDLEPDFTCTDVSFCETETTEVIGIGCVVFPPNGTLNWELMDSDLNQVSNGLAASYSVNDVLADYGPLSSTETFTASYSFSSESNCTYNGSYSITIEQLGIGDVILVDTCFNTEFLIQGNSDGNWSLGELPAANTDISSGDLIVFSDLDVGNYTGIEFDSGCSLQTYTINISELPSIEITGNNFICDSEGASQMLMTNASGIDSISFQWQNDLCGIGTDLNGETESSLNVTSAGSYSVVVTDSKGCTACSDIEILLDESPEFLCSDISLCENQVLEEFELDCVNLPSGINDGNWTIEHENNPNFPSAITSNNYSLMDLLQVYDPATTAIPNDESFTFFHDWQSDNGCLYTDSLQITVLDESVSLIQSDICSGEEINLLEANLGDWIWSTTPGSSMDLLNSDSFSWTTDISDAGLIHELRYTSLTGCGAVDYEIQVNATPMLSVSVPSVDMCILSEQLITLDQGIAEVISLDFELPSDVISLNTSDLMLNPSDLGVTDTDPGQLHFQGFIDYPTLTGGVLTCSSEAFQAIDIVDTLSSVAVPQFICQGEEFSIDLCNNAIVDDFSFSLGGENYSLADCPFEIPSLFGTQAYDLNAQYGSGNGQACFVQDAGEITIQQQLEYTYSSSFTPCSSEQEIEIEITSGNTESIVLLAATTLSSDELNIGDVLNSTLEFTPDDPSLDQIFNYDIQISDGVCTTEIISDVAQYIAVPEVAISIDELVSDFDGCGNDDISMEISVPNTSFIDSTEWTIESYYIPYEIIYSDDGLGIPSAIELGSPPLESGVVEIAVTVYNQCGMDVDTVFHVMNPSDVQLQIEDIEAEVCPGEVIEVNSTVNLENYNLEAEVTPAADVDWNPLTETLSVGENVPQGEYQVEFTAIGDCGIDVAFATFTVYEFYSAEFELTGPSCVSEDISFTPINDAELSGFAWDFGDTSESNQQNPIHSYNTPGTYQVSLTAFHSPANCVVSFTEEVVIGGSQVSILPGDIGYCGASEEVYSINLENPQSVQWNILNPYTEEIVEYLTESTPLLGFDFDENEDNVMEYLISVDVVDQQGCPSYEEVTASVFPTPKADIGYSIVSATSDVSTFFDGESLKVFLGIPCGDVEVQFFNEEEVNNCTWENGLGEPCGQSFDNCASLNFCADEEYSGTLEIEVDNEYQCVSTDLISVDFICSQEVSVFVPSSFTPNQDGLNDVFAYEFFGELQEFEFFIYNRWGEVIFHSQELGEYWDGSDEGGNYYVPNGVYSWMIKLNGGETQADVLRGHVTIVR